MVVWYYFQRLGDPLDPIAEMNSGPEDTTVTSSGGGVGDQAVVLAVADLEVIQNGKERIEGKDEGSAKPIPRQPLRIEHAGQGKRSTFKRRSSK